MKKVVLLAPTPPPAGGIAGWTQRMTEVKLKNGWKVDVVDEKVIGGRSVFGKKSKKNIVIEIIRCLKIWKNLSHSLKDKDSIIVQSCIPAGTTSMMREIICALITKLHRRKFIVHFRCTIPNMVKSKISLAIFKCLVGLSDCVFALNTASDDFVKMNKPGKKCYVIPNFIESKTLKQRQEYNEHIEKLIYVGGVIPEKGCDLIAELALRFPDKEFRLIGKLGMERSLFPTNVKLLGEQSKGIVQTELDNADVFIFFSRFSGEGFSNALAEAMSHSLPCIVSNWAANADMIENKGGIVLGKYSVKEAIDAVNQLESVEVRKKSGQWNYNKVMDSYIDMIVTGMYVDAYESLI